MENRYPLPSKFFKRKKFPINYQTFLFVNQTRLISDYYNIKRMLHFLYKKYQLYDNEYSSIIDIYFYATFSTQTLSTYAPKHFLDTLYDVLGKCLCFSLIKIESVSETQANPVLGTFPSSVVYTFRLKCYLQF